MKTSALLAALVVVLTIVPARADAQHLQLQMQNGLVTLDAQNVSIRQILAEWARVGGARIINGDKVLGAPVTLQLSGVPERQALDTILRGVSGYMLAARQDAASGLSQFDRILIMPTSSAPRSNPAPASATFNPRPMPTQPAPEPVETEVVEDEDRDQEEEEPGDPGEPEVVEEPVVQPQPGMNRGGLQRPPHFPNPMGAGQPFTPQPFPSAPQPVQSDEDGPPGQQPATTSPLNVPPGASTTPGVISPVPQDPQQPNARPRRPPR
jgi:hypothetical protein